MAVKVVTDSTCDLPQDLAQQRDITVIPCNVHFGDEVYKDGVDMGPDEFYRRLVSSPRLPTTAQPSVNDFLQVYRSLVDEGHDVVSIHLSAKFSGTLNSAIQARLVLSRSPDPELAEGEGEAGEEAPHSDQPGRAGRIEIVDSRMTSMGLGLVTLAAAQLVKEGVPYDRVVSGVQESLPSTHCYFLLDTLEYLQKGGRIGKASAFLGSLLSIKPVLMIKDGEAHPVERVRTRERGLQRLVEIIRGLAPAKYLSIIHSTTPDEAEALRERLGDILPKEEVIMSRFGPVIGTYLGPGALGVGLMSESFSS